MHHQASPSSKLGSPSRLRKTTTATTPRSAGRVGAEPKTKAAAVTSEKSAAVEPKTATISHPRSRITVPGSLRKPQTLATDPKSSVSRMRKISSPVSHPVPSPSTTSPASVKQRPATIANADSASKKRAESCPPTSRMATASKTSSRSLQKKQVRNWAFWIQWDSFESFVGSLFNKIIFCLQTETPSKKTPKGTGLKSPTALKTVKSSLGKVLGTKQVIFYLLFIFTHPGLNCLLKSPGICSSFFISFHSSCVYWQNKKTWVFFCVMRDSTNNGFTVFAVLPQLEFNGKTLLRPILLLTEIR